MTISTVNSTTPRREYTVTVPGQTVFSAPFEFFADADLLVYQVPSGVAPDDTLHLLTLTTDYTVTGADTSGGGDVTLVTGASVGDTVIIEAADAIDRSTAFLANGDLTIASMNEELNKLIMLNKQLAMVINERAVLLRRSASGLDLTLPQPTASKLLGWNTSADELINIATYSEKYYGAFAVAPSTNPHTGAAPATGDMYYDTTLSLMMVFDGAAWGQINSSVATAANAVNIADAGGYYVGTEVETALQELGAAGAAQASRTILTFTTTDAAADQLDAGWFKIRSAGSAGVVEYAHAGGGAVHNIIHRKGGTNAYTQGTITTGVPTQLTLAGHDVYEVYLKDLTNNKGAFIRAAYHNNFNIEMDIAWNE